MKKYSLKVTVDAWVGNFKLALLDADLQIIHDPIMIYGEELLKKSTGTLQSHKDLLQNDLTPGVYFVKVDYHNFGLDTLKEDSLQIFLDEELLLSLNGTSKDLFEWDCEFKQSSLASISIESSELIKIQLA